MSTIAEEIKKRRTFAIISHPDAGKTTLTEKFLLYGGAINLAGTVKGRKATKHAVSDWMEIEKERGISVTSSVMQFNYDGYCINILDTPGHQDFSEDTYRTLMAADSAVMVIDGSKGVEAQTIKLFKVCVMRKIPIFTFINKMDRIAGDPHVQVGDQIRQHEPFDCVFYCRHIIERDFDQAPWHSFAKTLQDFRRLLWFLCNRPVCGCGFLMSCRKRQSEKAWKKFPFLLVRPAVLSVWK